MEFEGRQISSFFDLKAWQQARLLTRAIYKETLNFPAEEKFSLTSQMRRASISVLANIAEGFGRLSIKEKINFYNQAHGSLTELQSHIVIAHDLKYIKDDDLKASMKMTHDTQFLLQGLIRSTKKRLK
jgi:four helix bundle protein